MTKKSLDPGAKRNLLILGVAGLVGLAAVAAMAYVSLGSSSKPKGGAAVADIAVAGSGSAEPRTKPLTPREQTAVNTVQTQEASLAQQRGQSYIPPDVSRPVPVDGASQGLDNGPGLTPHQARLQNSGGQAAGGGGQRQQLTQEEIDRNARRREGLGRQLEHLMTGLEGNASAKTAATPQRLAAPEAVAAASAPVPVRSNVSVGVAELPDVVGGLEIFAGVSMSPIDTYKTDYASAKIVSGKLSGAFLTGKVTSLMEGIQVTFNRMRWNGVTYEVNAIALDESTSTNAMSANVDRRYLERFVLPVIFSATAAYQAARAQTGTNVVVVSAGNGDSVSGIQQPAPTRQQARAAGIAEGMDVLGNEVQKAAAKPYQFTLESGVPLGIMFRDSVKAKANR